MFDDKSETELRAMAAQALREARRLPRGEARNEKRQIAVCLIYLAKRRGQDALIPKPPHGWSPYPMMFR